MASATQETEEVTLGIFEKYLTLWIAICIVVGLLLGRFLPQFGQYLDSLKFGQISIPIGILLFLMMYPTVVGISFSDVKKATKFPKPMLITIIANWVIAPPLMALYANFFLKGNPQFIAGAILLGISPCTAMVLWWIKMARGDLGQGLVNTAINALLMIALYGTEAAFYLGVSSIPVPWDLIVWSVILFIAVPVSLAALTRRTLLLSKGEAWFEGRFRPILRKNLDHSPTHNPHSHVFTARRDNSHPTSHSRSNRRSPPGPLRIDDSYHLWCMLVYES